MKKTLIQLFASLMLLCSCGNGDSQYQADSSGNCPMEPALGQKSSVFRQKLDSLKLYGITVDKLPTKDGVIDTVMVDSVASMVRELGLRMTPYGSISEIELEFSKIHKIMTCGYDYNWHDLLESILLNRMRFHLSNPVTFQSWNKSSTYKPFRVTVSLDGKYKFYTTWNISDGTMGHWVTFYQYVDQSGQLVCKEWQGDRRFDCQGNVVDVWQFNLHDTTFYVLKSVWQGSSCERGYSMEIVTFDNGVPAYHIHFWFITKVRRCG